MRDFTTIRISKRLKHELDMDGSKGDTYEQIIWRLKKKKGILGF